MVFYLGGAFAIFSGIKKIVIKNKKKRCFLKTEGVVYGHNTDMTNDSYFPAYEYFVNNTRYTISSIWLLYRKRPLGESATILYNPEKPAEALVDMPLEGFLRIIFGIIFLIGVIIIHFIWNFFAA